MDGRNFYSSIAVWSAVSCSSYRVKFMKAILEFNLPEDKEEFDASSNGMDWSLLVWHIDEFIRNKIKYEQDRDGALQLVRNELNFRMEEKGLKYPE